MNTKELYTDSDLLTTLLAIGYDRDEAQNDIFYAAEEIKKRIAEGDESAHDICQEYFGLEPDYIFDLLDAGEGL